MDILDKIAESEMRAWLLECFSDEYEQEHINELNFKQLVNSVNRYYDGGYKSFLASMLWMDA